jgi:multimeric flavodoxin WrbA
MSERKILILLGSPRKTGNSSVLADSLAKGTEKAGARVETLFLHDLHVNPCSGCNSCQMENAQGCVIDDAMREVYRKIVEADAVVFASPIYWFSVTAQLKTVIDRIYAVGGGTKNILRGKTFGIVLTYADSDPFISGAVNALRMFQDIAAYLGATIAGSVYGSAYEPGEIAENIGLLDAAYKLGEKLGKGD